MLKRVLSSVLCVVAMVIVMQAMAEAGTGTISGTSISQCICFSATGAVVSCSGSYAFKKCSIDASTLLKSLGNVTSGPNATNTAYAVTLFLEDATVFCVNKAGNAGNANGQPFEQIEAIQLTDLITNKRIDKNGKATSDLIFSDELLLSTTGFTSADLCQNSNWTAKVFVQNLQAYGRLFQDNSTTSCDLNAANFNGCDVSDRLDVACGAPQGANVTTPFTYSCTTLCHDDAGTACPFLAPSTNDPSPPCLVDVVPNSNPPTPTTNPPSCVTVQP